MEMGTIWNFTLKIDSKMTKRLSLRSGDVFEVPIDGYKQFIQYVMDDSNMFGANVIRAFEFEIPSDEDVNLNDLLEKKIKFYTHTMIKGGLKLCNWKKIGNLPLEDSFSAPLFRATDDVYSEVKKSSNWYIWRAGEESRRIGKLTQQYRSLDYGSVFHPIDIGEWLRTGSNGFMFPD